MSGICDTCGDDRFELIAKAKQKLLDATNINSRPDEVAVLDSILFRCWQMGWLDQLSEDNSCAECAEGMGRYADSLCDPLKQRIAELERQRDALLRCLENDYGIKASWDGLRKLWNIELTEEGVNLRDATGGTLTAEQVMAIAGRHQPDYCSDTHVCFDWQAIANELNATLGGGECEFVIEDNMNESEGKGDVWFRCTNCNTIFDYYADNWLMEQNYCPHCGFKIRKAVKR